VIEDVSSAVVTDGEAPRDTAVVRRQCAYIGPRKSWMSTRRWDSIRSACEWSGLDIVHIPSSRPAVEDGRRLAREVLASGTTAVLAYNDLLAIGLMQELQAAGVQVPGQVSIIGFEDIFGADFPTPALTTVRSPSSACGVRATELLLATLRSGLQTSFLHVETGLVVRGSSGRLTGTSTSHVTSRAHFPALTKTGRTNVAGRVTTNGSAYET
jgi:LacI family transcriptional regulator